MKLDGVLIPVVIDGLTRRKDGSVGIKLETQEISSQKAGELFSLAGKHAFAYLSAVQPDENEKKVIDSLDPEIKGKTPSKRLHDVLFVYWNQNKGSATVPEVFDYFYKQKMESFIEMVKSELI
jgi:hypothetical protein